MGRQHRVPRVRKRVEESDFKREYAEEDEENRKCIALHRDSFHLFMLQHV